jgi:hypothetical protein
LVLSGENQKRYTVRVGSVDSADEIGSARTHSAEADSRFAGGARVSVCHVGSRRFMACVNDFDAEFVALSGEHVVEGIPLVTDDSEDEAYLLLGETTR